MSGEFFRVEIKGMKKVAKKLSKLDAKLAKKTLRRGLRAGAKVVGKEARSLAPVKSGLTKKSHKVRAAKGEKGEIKIKVGVGDGWFKGDTFYAAFVHYGHKVGSRKLGDKRTTTEPNPWIEKAYDRTKQQAAKKVFETLRDELKK